jgi:hypothetical protein
MILETQNMNIDAGKGGKSLNMERETKNRLMYTLTFS